VWKLLEKERKEERLLSRIINELNKIETLEGNTDGIIALFLEALPVKRSAGQFGLSRRRVQSSFTDV
jgi:hypothetical protein